MFAVFFLNYRIVYMNASNYGLSSHSFQWNLLEDRDCNIYTSCCKSALHFLLMFITLPYEIYNLMLDFKFSFIWGRVRSLSSLVTWKWLRHNMSWLYMLTAAGFGFFNEYEWWFDHSIVNCDISCREILALMCLDMEIP